ncbi:putative THOC5 family protein [Fonsecaea pedrosoi]|nr:putative THOC5 family protein [Fonsecaea pedrosoi]
MAIDDLITDPALQPLLQTSHATLAQTISVLTWLEEHAATSNPTLEQKLELAQQHKILNAYLAKLRGQHRQAAFGVRATKQETAEARQEVDRLLLQLQNLYYEQRHLLGEIGTCEAYDHLYMHLPLHPLDEYIAMFPDQAELPEQELMPLRIEYEKQEREKMEQKRLELVKIKDSLVKENTRKKDELKKMDEKLEVMIDGLKPLEEALQKEL